MTEELSIKVCKSGVNQTVSVINGSVKARAVKTLEVNVVIDEYSLTVGILDIIVNATI